MIFNLFFPNNTILFFIYLYYLFFFITQIFEPNAELTILIEIPTNEAKAEIETPPVIVETKISRCSM